MTLTRFQLAVFAATLASGVVHAASNIQEVQQRNVYQEQRILDGLKSGSISTREAAQLEREQQQILLMQAEALKRKGMTEAEQARVTAEQTKVSQHIAEAQQNDSRGDPTSESSRAMQEAIAQNVEQQRRIQDGLARGTLTNEEVLKLQQGQARVAALQAKLSQGGLSEAEQARIGKVSSAQGGNIYDQKRDDQERSANGSVRAGSNIQAVQQRNVYQEQRILDGLKSGSISTREAAQLEREQQQILLMEVDALKRRGMTEAEQARITAEQNKVSQHIAEAQQNDARGNPTSESSREMQEAVARNVYQQRRIQEGLANGSLTNQEVLNLQQGQARVVALEAKLAQGGLSDKEQTRIDKNISSQSGRIYDQKHDEQDRRENEPK
jgi:hypothetical protein